jgi:hypothetical protein
MATIFSLPIRKQHQRNEENFSTLSNLFRVPIYLFFYIRFWYFSNLPSLIAGRESLTWFRYREYIYISVGTKERTPIDNKTHFLNSGLYGLFHQVSISLRYVISFFFFFWFCIPDLFSTFKFAFSRGIGRGAHENNRDNSREKKIKLQNAAPRKNRGIINVNVSCGRRLFFQIFVFPLLISIWKKKS